MIDHKRYKENFLTELKTKSIDELAEIKNLVILHGSDGHGRLAEVPLIKCEVINELIRSKIYDQRRY